MNPLNHVAIIMDGNGRWGLKNKKNRNLGHKEGLKVLEKIISETIKQKIRYLTVFAFSTENWKRPKEEIRYLFDLLEFFLKSKLKKISKKNIKLKFLGNNKFSKNIKNSIINAEKITKNNTLLQLNIALNYGFKEELIYSIKKILKKKESINATNISNNLYTKSIPDPDLLIRTGNTKRLSNFLLWQIIYTEIFFVKDLWPDFNEIKYKKIIKKFKFTKRNFGTLG
jgi:undecaprenyl diphosphate synthase